MPRSRSLCRLLVFCCLVVTTGTTSPAADAPADVAFEEDVVYGKAGDVELKLNIARPKDAAGPLPCVLIIHGGGGEGNKDQHSPQTWEFARRGYVAATIGYRLVPTARFPAQVHDVKCAVRFLRAHATKYNVDAEKIGAVGFSAGAHLSMMLAVTEPEDGLEGEGGWKDQSSRISAAVSFFGPTDMARDDIPQAIHGLVKDFTSAAPAKGNPECQQASPITYVDKGDAPILLLQGTADPLVPYNQAILMAEAMIRAEIPGRLELIFGAGHGWGPPELQRTAEETLRFFDLHLKPATQEPAATPAR